MMDYLIWIDLTYACGGIVANGDGIITESAPIWKGWIGKKFRAFITYEINRKKFNRYKLATKKG